MTTESLGNAFQTRRRLKVLRVSGHRGRERPTARWSKRRVKRTSWGVLSMEDFSGVGAENGCDHLVNSETGLAERAFACATHYQYLMRKIWPGGIQCDQTSAATRLQNVFFLFTFLPPPSSVFVVWPMQHASSPPLGRRDTARDLIEFEGICAVQRRTQPDRFAPGRRFNSIYKSTVPCTRGACALVRRRCGTAAWTSTGKQYAEWLVHSERDETYADKV